MAPASRPHCLAQPARRSSRHVRILAGAAQRRGKIVAWILAVAGLAAIAIVGVVNYTALVELALTINANAPLHSSVLRNEGKGTFAAPVSYPVADNPRSVVPGDLDADGDVDVVVAHENPAHSIDLLYNLADCTFAPEVSHGVAGSSTFSALIDIDGDGDADLRHRTTTPVACPC